MRSHDVKVGARLMLKLKGPDWEPIRIIAKCHKGFVGRVSAPVAKQFKGSGCEVAMYDVLVGAASLRKPNLREFRSLQWPYVDSKEIQ